jgi:hypothetical protein
MAHPLESYRQDRQQFPDDMSKLSLQIGDWLLFSRIHTHKDRMPEPGSIYKLITVARDEKMYFLGRLHRFASNNSEAVEAVHLNDYVHLTELTQIDHTDPSQVTSLPDDMSLRYRDFEVPNLVTELLHLHRPGLPSDSSVLRVASRPTLRPI